MRSEELRSDGGQSANKAAIQNEILSPESPGEDWHREERERIKSSSSERGRRQQSKGSPRRDRDTRSDDSAKRKAPEIAEVYSASHNSGRTEEAKKRSKKSSPGKQGQSQSRRYA